VAVHGREDEVRFANDAAGIADLIAWLQASQVARVGLEASGGYERALRRALDAHGFEVVVHQPLEVRRFAQVQRWRAKNDRLDARLIAAATAQVDAVRAAQDPRLEALAQQLTVYESLTEQTAALKTLLSMLDDAALAAELRSQIEERVRHAKRLMAGILARIRSHTDLLARLRLLLRLPGFGPIVAATMVIRMPELAGLRRGQAASFVGVAPFDRQSGQWKGQRFIAGGRNRPRRMLYLAALAAKRYHPDFKAFAERLQARGKPAKVVLVAIMRKLIEAANLVLARGTPWQRQPA